MTVDSNVVLWGQTLAYSIYCVIMILLVGWFGIRVTKEGKSDSVKPAVFYTFVGFLTVLGVSLHLVTMETIPWVKMDLNRNDIKADKVFNITVENHKFQLPADKMEIDCHDKVLFNVTSNDLTYGFGIFRQDNSMVFQMQVVPGHKNDIMWQFENPGLYTIRSTEYSGPKGVHMIETDVVEVKACN